MLEQGSAKNSISRRDFLRLLTAGGIATAFAPFVQWGKYMPNPEGTYLKRQR